MQRICLSTFPYKAYCFKDRFVLFCECGRAMFLEAVILVLLHARLSLFHSVFLPYPSLLTKAIFKKEKKTQIQFEAWQILYRMSP